MVVLKGLEQKLAEVGRLAEAGLKGAPGSHADRFFDIIRITEEALTITVSTLLIHRMIYALENLGVDGRLLKDLKDLLP